MVRCEDFAKFILKFNPQNSPARLALYNYFKNLTNLESEFSIQHIDSFFRKCLTFEFWRKETEDLTRETLFFVKKFSDEQRLSFPNFRPVDKMQAVQVTNSVDKDDILKGFLISRQMLDRTSIVHEGAKSFLVTVIPNSGIQVCLLTDWYLIRDGRLDPLSLDHILYYDNSLELAMSIQQSIEILPQTTARFRIHPEQVDVHYIQGMTFKKVRMQNFKKLHEDKHLYFSLKKLERHFVDRTTDPMYLDVIQSLEEALYRVEAQGATALEFALQSLEIGDNFYREAFPDDKMLAHLLEDLRLLLTKKGLWKNSSDLINLELKTVL